MGEPTKSLALRNVTVIDGTGKPAMTGMTVVFDGYRIQAVEAMAGTALAPGTQVIESSGKFLIPGLWDMHAHPAILGPPVTGNNSLERVQISPLFIPNGVVAIRTMGGPPEFASGFAIRRNEIAEGKRLGPRLVVASPTLEGDIVVNAEIYAAAFLTIKGPMLFTRD